MNFIQNHNKTCNYPRIRVCGTKEFTSSCNVCHTLAPERSASGFRLNVKLWQFPSPLCLISESAHITRPMSGDYTLQRNFWERPN